MNRLSKSLETALCGIRRCAGATLASLAFGVQAHPQVGQVIEYSVAGYTIRMEMLTQTSLRWTYLDAPTAAEKGKTETETIDTVVLRPDVLLAAWTEKSGAHVVDVFDFGQRRVIANFVMPDGKRYQSQASFKVIRP